MKNVYGSLLTILAFINFGFSQNNDFKTLAIKEKMPLITYEMKACSGEVFTLEKAKKNKGLLIIFSCNTCPFVVGNESFKGWESQYNSLYEIAVKAEVGMVLVNSNEGKRKDEDSFEAMQKHASELNYAMPYLLDNDANLANAFGARTTPHVFLFDSEMRLIYQGSIDNTWDTSRSSDIPYLHNALTNLMEGNTVLENTTSPKGCSIKRVKK